jgi:hypothetical protein
VLGFRPVGYVKLSVTLHRDIKQRREAFSDGWNLQTLLRRN